MNDDIKFACEKCGQSVSVASVHAGVSLHCPGCGGPLTVPTGVPGSGAGSSGTGGISFKSDAANSEHKSGELVVKRYRLERILGRGGMGVVWLANDEQLNEPVALKFVPPEIRSDKDALKDLRRETQKSRKLSHPNIIRIHDLTQSEDTAPFISMEFVAGETMSSLRGKQPNGLFTWETLRPLVTQLCAALDYAHSQGIVHRDLKPANLMVTESGQVKLADFGIAATISDTMGRVSLDNLSSGTPTYMSPQQIEGFPPSARDDVYALGATLYDLLTSKPPFFRGKIIHQVLNVAPVTPEERLKELGLTNAIPPEVSAAIMACLVKDSDQRLPNVAAVAQALGLPTGGLASSPAVSVGTASQPPAAVPPAEAAPEPRISNRKMMYWAAAAAALVLILGGLTVAFNRNKSVRESPSTKGPASNSVAAQPQTKPTANPAKAGGVAPSVPAMALRDNLAIGRWIERFTNGNISGATYEFFTDQTLLRSYNGQARKSTWRWMDAPARTILIETDGKPEIEVVIAPDGKSAAAKNLRNGARPVWFRPESSPAAPPNTSSSSIAATKDAPFVNTLGMKFVPVPGITALFSVWETRAQDYELFAKETQRAWRQPRTQQQPTLPASMVNFADAEAFCAWLTKKETAAGKLPAGFTYRVPTDAEWSAAVGLPPEPGATPAERNGANPSHFPWGRPWPPTTKEGNYHETDMPAPDGYEETAPVGTFSPNALGIFDLGGNVWEWTSDWYDATQTDRALRGASYQTSSWQFLRSAHRDHYKPTAPFPNVGFRCVLAPAASSAATATKEAPFINTLGMKFVPVPITGGPTSGQRVLFSVWSTRVQDFELFASESQSNWVKPTEVEQGPTHPAASISWNDANGFCAWLTARERKAGRLAANEAYRIPSDYEWSCAVGIGDREDPAWTPEEKDKKLENVFAWGSQWPPPPGVGNHPGEEVIPAKAAGKFSYVRDVIAGYRDDYVTIAPVGSFPANRFGLFDMTGNVWHWTSDWHNAEQKERTMRGCSWGSWDRGALLLSSRRPTTSPNYRGTFNGFRCVLASASVIMPAATPTPRSPAERHKFVDEEVARLKKEPASDAIKLAKLEKLAADYPEVPSRALHNELRHLYSGIATRNPKKEMEQIDIILKIAPMDNYAVNLLGGGGPNGATNLPKLETTLKGAVSYGCVHVQAACAIQIGDVLRLNQKNSQATPYYESVLKLPGIQGTSYETTAKQRLGK